MTFAWVDAMVWQLRWSAMREHRRARLDHLPALDGLRGVAVTGVLAFHGGKLTGGFLGVDLFFVLSGFLITSLLLVEWDEHGSIDLRGFWTRRARRLLPAVFGLVALVAVLAAVFAKAYELDPWRWDSFATLFYVANWWQIAGGAGYWEQFNAPSPLRHTWSLAIEEQFYLIWPLIFIGVLTLVRGSKRVLLAVSLGLAVLSSTLMLVLFEEGDPNRVYLGTDTRAAAVLLGASLAIALRLWGPVAGRWARVVLEAVALAAAATLLSVWLLATGTTPALYRFGFFVLGVLSVVVIAAAVHPVRGPLGAALSWRPLRALGLISYGLYLWHWPVYIVVDANRVWLDARGFNEWLILALKLSMSLAVAVASYFILEQPIRHRGLAAWRRPVLLPATAGFVVLALLWSTVGGVDRSAITTPAASAEGTAGASAAEERRALPDLANDPDGSALMAGSTTSTAPPPPEGPLPRPGGRRARVMVVGDSVAWNLGESMVKLSPALNITATNRALFACPLSSDSGRSRAQGQVVNERAECREWPKYFIEDVYKFRPDVVFMHYGGPPPEQRELAGTWQDLCSPAWDAWYRGQVSEAIDILSTTGATVFIAPAAYSRFPWMDWAAQDPRTDCMSKVYREVAATKPAARILALDRFVCPDRTCLDEMDGITLREDGIHYDKQAADFMARWVVSQMLAP
ncbi:MAG: acyltransferase [Actinobacteria bacterium]|nr:acyltransferase [Actinomycetota bacterium]